MSVFTKQLRGRRRGAVLFLCVASLVAAFALSSNARTRAQGGGSNVNEAQIQTGLDISPVTIDLRGRNRALVGLGSYIVNAVAGCSDCHTWPQYVPGGDPFLGQPEQINAARYLGGGRPFGPFVSNNITPDAVTGLPGGMTFNEFLVVMRSGVDRDHSPPPVPSPANDLLQVMPWPVFRNMTARDLRAIYEYLSAIPSVP